MREAHTMPWTERYKEERARFNKIKRQVSVRHHTAVPSRQLAATFPLDDEATHRKVKQWTPDMRVNEGAAAADFLNKGRSADIDESSKSRVARDGADEGTKAVAKKAPRYWRVSANALGPHLFRLIVCWNNCACAKRV